MTEKVTVSLGKGEEWWRVLPASQKAAILNRMLTGDTVSAIIRESTHLYCLFVVLRILKTGTENVSRKLSRDALR